MNRLLPLMFAISGCSLGSERAGSLASGDMGDRSDSGLSTSGSGDGGWEADSGLSLEPAAWWRLGGEIDVGAPVASDGDLATNALGGRLTLVSLDASELVRCTAEAEIDRLTLLATPEPELYVWWQVTVGNWTGDCVSLGAAVPVSTLQLGIGSLHPELAAVLGSVDAAAAGSERTLNGAYARLDTASPVYAFGLAGPAAAFGGVGAATEAAPLAEGTWRIEPAYSFAAGDGW